MSDCNCPLKQAAKEAPSHLVVGSATFQELDCLAEEFSFRLIELGIKAGDRIAILHPPCIESIALFFAIWRIRASFCPLSLRLPSQQIESSLKSLDAKLFIDSFPLKQTTRKCLFSPLASPSILVFTSGSTSIPKIAVLSLASLLSNAAPALKELNLTAKDKWLLNLPLYHVSGLGILLRCILARAHVVFDEQDPGITHISAVPTQLYRATPIYKHLKCLLIGGAPIATYPEKLPCYVSYGLTEMGSLVAANPSPQPIEGKLPIGFPLPGREMRISPEGVIEVRGSTLFDGYWHEGAVLPSLSSDGWFSTGDIGRLSKQGFLIHGRKDWQFISGGENIQPEEIEGVLALFPGVIEAVVLPIADPEYGFLAAAWIRSSHQSLSPTSLRAHLSERLPKFKVPKRFFFVDDFPRNGLKIDRRSLLQNHQ